MDHQQRRIIHHTLLACHEDYRCSAAGKPIIDGCDIHAAVLDTVVNGQAFFYISAVTVDVHYEVFGRQTLNRFNDVHGRSVVFAPLPVVRRDVSEDVQFCIVRSIFVFEFPVSSHPAVFAPFSGSVPGVLRFKAPLPDSDDPAEPSDPSGVA